MNSACYKVRLLVYVALLVGQVAPGTSTQPLEPTSEHHKTLGKEGITAQTTYMDGGKPAWGPDKEAAKTPIGVSDRTDAFRFIKIGSFNDTLLDDCFTCRTVRDTIQDLEGKPHKCEEKELLHPITFNTMMKTVMPLAINLHVERLKIQPDLVPPKVKGTGADMGCQFIKVPTAHVEEGILEHDFAIYVRAAGTDPLIKSFPCWHHGPEKLAKRPFAGYLSFNPRPFNEKTTSVFDFKRMAAGRIGRLLGFQRNFFVHLLRNQSVRGVVREVFTGPCVLQFLKEYYDCPTIEGIELPINTSYEFWTGRIVRNDLMSFLKEGMRYTNLTLAFFKDLGYYEVDYSKAEPMAEPLVRGCAVFNEKCLTENATHCTLLDEELFCVPSKTFDSKENATCTTGRLNIGACTKKVSYSYIPPGFRYFKNERYGGLYPEPDYCPVRIVNPSTSCLYGKVSEMPGSVINEESRCFDEDSAHPIKLHSGEQPKAICAEVKCYEDRYQIKVKGSPKYYDCHPSENMRLAELSGSIFISGAIVCPDWKAVCGYCDTTHTCFTSKPGSDNGSLPVNGSEESIRGSIFLALFAVAFLLFFCVT